MEIKALRLEDLPFMGYAVCMNSQDPSDQPQSLNPFRTLQENASRLFDEIQSRQAAQMICQSGCSKCCHAEFSVFLGEALVLIEWFDRLASHEKSALRKEWQTPTPAGACAFLVNDRCSVYEARPVICRTQGAPLRFSRETSREKRGKPSEIEQTIDACPLNFDGGKSIPKQARDWFDLDRLTELQAVAENFVQKNTEIPEEIKALCDNNGRVPLRKLHAFLKTRQA